MSGSNMNQHVKFRENQTNDLEVIRLATIFTYELRDFGGHRLVVGAEKMCTEHLVQIG